MPTAKRAPSATLVRRGGDRLLFDCAEGTQRQLLRSDVGLAERRGGLPHALPRRSLPRPPGHAQDLRLRGREVPLTIYGPQGLEELFGALKRIFGQLTYPVSTVVLEPDARLEREGYAIEPFEVDHRVAAIGYALVEDVRPGRFDVDEAIRLGVPDGRERGLLQRGERDARRRACGRAGSCSGRAPRRTQGRPHGRYGAGGSVVDAATGADLLIHEATFLADERDRARETGHSTAGEAALVARGRCEAARSRTSRRATSGIRSSTRRRSCSRRPSCRATSTS